MENAPIQSKEELINSLIPNEERERRIKEIHQLAGQEKTKLAIQHAEQLLCDLTGQEHAELTLLKSRMSNIEKKELMGTVHAENINVEKAQILHSLINFVNFLRSEDTYRTVTENADRIKDIESRLTFSIEIAKERMTKIGECWKAMHAFENKLFRIVEEFLENLLDEESLDEKGKELFICFKDQKNLINLYNLLSEPTINGKLEKATLSGEAHNRLLRKLEKVYEEYLEEADWVLEINQFWLGKDIYESGRAYHNCYPTFLRNYRRGDYPGCLECLKIQKDALKSIKGVINELQKEAFGMR